MPRQHEIQTHHIPTSRIPSYVHLLLPVVEVSPVHPICPVLMPPLPPPALGFPNLSLNWPDAVIPEALQPPPPGFPNPSPRWPDAVLPEALQSPATSYVLPEHTATVTATPPQPALFHEHSQWSELN
jgi:hypothetical protein